MPEYCPTCGAEVMLIKDADWEENKIVHTFPVDETLNKVLNKYNVPFRCKSCGSLKFPYQATLDRVFVYPDPPAETIGQAGLIYLPPRLQEHYRNEYGVVLSVGKGYVHKTKRRFIPTEVKVGDRVAYDKTVFGVLPPVEGSDGKMYVIKLMGEQDIHGIVEE